MSQNSLDLESPLSDADRLPLTALQKSMLAANRLSPISDLNVEQWLQILPESLDPVRLRKAWQRVWERHPALRSGFAWDQDGVPYQWTSSSDTEFPVVEVDLSAEGDRQELCWEEQVARDRKSGFDLAHPPCTRLLIARLAEDNWRACWTVHHILVDGRSMGIVLKEVFSIYDGKDLPSDIDDAFHRHVCRMSSFDLSAESEARDFWRQSLSGATSMGRFPFERAGASPESTQTSTLTCLLPSDISSRLHEFAASIDVTVNTLVQGAWGQGLGLFSGATDIVFGTLRSGRPSDLPGAKEGVGLFVQSEPIRIQGWDTEITVSQWLQRLRSRSVAAREYGWVGTGQISAWLGQGGEAPLIGSLLAFERNRPEDELEQTCGGDRGRRFALRERADFPLILSAWEREPMGLSLAFDETRYPVWAMEELLETVRHLLQELSRDPARQLREIPLLSAKRQQERQRWNDTDVASTSHRQLLHAGFEATATRDPARPCLRVDNRWLTYGDLEKAANQIAHYLIEAGIKPESRVALWLQKSIQLPAAILGVLKAGGAYIPIDRGAPVGSLERMLDASSADLLIVDNWLPPGLKIPANCRTLAIGMEWENLESFREESPVVDIRGDHLAYGIFTSGTTGIPKLVGVEHRSAANLVEFASDELFESADLARVPFIDNIAFDSSISQIFVTWALGGALIFPARGTEMSCTEVTIDPTSIGTVPSGLMALLDAGELPSSVRVVGLGGEAIPALLLERLGKLSHVRKVYNYYGPTETTVYSMVARVMGPGSPSRDPLCDRGRNLGYPIRNTRIYVLDQCGRPVPLGAPGEIFIGGIGVTRGYLGAPELTAERFRPDPWADESTARLYQTGDLGLRLPDGSVEFLGRRDHQVKLRGHRIELGAIEAELARHPALQDAIVIAREAAPGIQHLVAYLIPKSLETVPTQAELRAFLEPKLPEYMIPVAAVAIESRPISPSGKLDRNALPAVSFASEQERIEPVTDLEEKLKRIWVEVLGHDDFGVTDNFFEIGGHSLATIRLVSRIEQTLDLARQFPVSDLFQAPTIRALAAMMSDGKDHSRLESVVPLQPLGSGPPLFFLHGVTGGVTEHLRTAHLLAPTIPVYGVQVVESNGRLAPFTTVDEMTSHYVREIRMVQQNGPYFLAGFCVGGCLAFETARRLREEGAEIGAVFIEDAVPVGWLPFRVWAPYRARQMPEMIWRHSSNLLRIPFWKWPQYVLERTSYGRSSTMQSEADDTFDAYNNPVVDTVRFHRFKRLDAKTILLCSNHFPDSTIFAWKAMSCGRLSVHRVLEKHKNFPTDAAPVIADIIRTEMSQRIKPIESTEQP